MPTETHEQRDNTPAGWRGTLHEIIFESDTPAGKAFDIALIVVILASVLVVMLDSVREIRAQHHTAFYIAEWVFTLLFTVEYLLRIIAVQRPARYIRSFFGVVDLLAILPTYISLLVPGAEYFLVIRMLRVLRIFRIFKLAHYLTEANTLVRAMRASRRKIEVFITAVITIVIIFGSLMYFVEGETNGFTSIPRSVYWAIVTLTTVGYGDIHPRTGLGQAVAAVIMILGYAIIAVPTGIVTAEIARADRAAAISGQACPSCGAEGHDMDARFCKYCSARL